MTAKKEASSVQSPLVFASQLHSPTPVAAIERESVSMARQEPVIDVIIPCYNEPEEAVSATVEACLQQTWKPRKIYVVDDCSTTPVQLGEALKERTDVCLLRQETNQGIAAARNFAAMQSDADYFMFLNCEVLLAPNWLEAATSYLQAHPEVGSAGGRIVPLNARSLLAAWRMRFLENPEERGDTVREIKFATGHAVLVRRTAFQKLGGYDIRYQRTHEDSDLGRRLRQNGYTNCYIADAWAKSTQIDTIKLFAQKNIRHNQWSLDPGLKNDAVLRPLVVRQAILGETRSLRLRLMRNLGKGRLHFLPIDFLVWATGVRLILRAGPHFDKTRQSR